METSRNRETAAEVFSRKIYAEIEPLTTGSFFPTVKRCETTRMLFGS